MADLVHSAEYNYPCYSKAFSILSQKAENTYDNDYADTQRIIYYSCAGVSLAGIIVILTGLHKEYIDGIKVAENWVIKDNGAGLSLSCKF